MTRRRFHLLAVAALFIAMFPATSGQEQTAPRLVLMLAIDQMRFEYLTRLAPLYKGGLKTLLDRGAVYTNAFYRHAATETGPGHSVLLSGRHPSHSGIVANDWWDPFLKKSINVVDDPLHRSLGGEGRSASPINFLGFTLGDVLKQRSPQSRVVGVSLKDRSAILMGGRLADAAYWYETAGGRFVTSTYYMSSAPPWLSAWNGRRLADQYHGKLWTRLLSDLAIYENYAGADAIDGEWDRKDTMFPHAIRGNPPDRAYYDDLRRTPFGDELTLSVALEAMKAHQLGADEHPDIFAIGFSSTDVIGHTYGATSQEVMDQLLRLDLLLQQLFTEIDRTVGFANTIVVLSADHGSLPLVETLQARGVEARRASPKILESAVQKALAQRFPDAKGLIAYFSTDIYFDEDVLRQHHLDREAVERTAIDALLSTGLIEKVYTQNDLMRRDDPADPYFALFRNSFYQPRSPHLSVLVKKHIYMSSAVGGTGHGTAHDYDRHVPVVFLGTGIKAGRFDAQAGPEDIAPTLAHLLKLSYPIERDSRVLAEALK